LKQNTAGLDLAARRGHTSLVSFSRSVVMRCLDELTAPRRYEGLNRRGRRQYAQASGRLLWLGFEMHYLAHLVVCRIGCIQPDHPPLSTFNIGKESPMSRTATVAEFVELNRG